jgi:hypothetical protein
MPSYRELVNQLPHRLRVRFESLSAYVKSIIDEEEQNVPDTKKLNQDAVQSIQLLVFAHTLNHFFQEGSRAARSAVATFEALGVSGFTVGSTTFEGDNENVQRGDVLSRELQDSLSAVSAFDPQHSALGVRQLTRRLMKQLKNG